jgi:hypothetical protein
LTCTLVVAAIDPGTGYFSGFFAAVVVSTLIWCRHAWSWESDTLDVVAAISIGLVLLSPYWHAETSAQTSPSHGAAVSLIFFVAVRIVVTDALVFRELITQVGILCAAYAGYFLAFATAYDLINNRAAVSFANANYTGAVLAFGGAVTLFLAASSAATARFLWLAASVLQAVAIYESGSRASFAGLLATALLMSAWRWAPVLSGALVKFAVIVGFFLALIPNSIALFTRPAYWLASAGTFDRGQAAADNASGRSEIWAQATAAVDQSWLTGWGPGNYYLTVGTDPTFLAHAWGLEYLLSVGVLGTVFVAALLLGAYNRGTRGSGALWTASTALSLLPSLMVSTHQWTLWAWFAFALWSRADLLAGPTFFGANHRPRVSSRTV